MLRGTCLSLTRPVVDYDNGAQSIHVFCLQDSDGVVNLLMEAM
jgi:hypothetical protein